MKKILYRLSGLARLINKLLSKFGVQIADVDSVITTSPWGSQLLYFARLLSLVKNVDGDIVECGVASGKSLITLSFLNSLRDKPRRIWGFDSFEGLPEPTQEDLSPTSIAEKGMFNESRREVVRIKVNGHVLLVTGWFKDTLPEFVGKIALLHLDADLYESTKCVLDTLWDKVVTGGVICFDNYQEPEVWPGEKKAVDEFIKHERDYYYHGPILHKDLSANRYYLIKYEQGRGVPMILQIACIPLFVIAVLLTPFIMLSDLVKSIWRAYASKICS